jgi:hypothetical protein
MRGRPVIAVAALLTACSGLAGEGEVTYQQILRKLCLAPPSVMNGVLTTPQLQQAWAFICAHTESVSAARVP